MLFKHEPIPICSKLIGNGGLQAGGYGAYIDIHKYSFNHVDGRAQILYPVYS